MIELTGMGYTKLFSSIVASTIWREDVSTKVLWVTMLAMKNERHVVEGSVPGLAHLAGVSLEDCEASLKKLIEPDPYSRNQEHEGRRIEAVDGGWLILNGEYYRKKMSQDERREYQRIKQAQYRQEKSERVSKKDGKAGKDQAFPDNLRSEAFKNIWGQWLEHLSQKKKPPTNRAIDLQLKKLSAMGEARAIAALENSICGNYQGIFESSSVTGNGCGQSVFALREIIKAKELQCSDLKLKHCSEAAMGDVWTDKKSKEQFQVLRKEIKELNGRIAGALKP